MSQRKYKRWDMQQVRQHQLLVSAVLLLTITGMPLRYADQAAGQKLAILLGGASVMAALHRLGGIMLTVALFWHIGYVLLRVRRGTMRWSTLPKWKDVTDAWELFLYLIGRRPTEPSYERYSFLEKFDYWAATGGSCAMISTGLILWFPGLAARLVGPTGINLASVFHSLEAVLAASFLLIGHVYHVHLAGGLKPFNMVWWTGEMTRHEMEEKHPLELARLDAAEAAEVEPPAPEPVAPPAATLEPEPEPALDDEDGDEVDNEMGDTESDEADDEEAPR